MESEILSISLRNEVGKNAVKRMLKNGFVPAVVYGHNKTNILVKISQKEVKTILKHRGKSVFFILENSDDSLNGKKLLVKSIMKDPVYDTVKHIDFYEMSEKEMTKFYVPIKLVGKAQGLVQGGVLEWEKREVELKALPENVPDLIEVDVTNLTIGHSIHLSELKLPEGVKLAEDGNIAIVTMLAPKVQVELTPEEKEAQLQASLAAGEKEKE